MQYISLSHEKQILKHAGIANLHLYLSADTFPNVQIFFINNESNVYSKNGT
jgi:hypothetical protein